MKSEYEIIKCYGVGSGRKSLAIVLPRSFCNELMIDNSTKLVAKVVDGTIVLERLVLEVAK